MRLGLPLLIYVMASTALAGAAITAVLAAGMDGWQPIAAAAGAGALVGIPVAIWATNQIRNLR